MVVVSWLCPSNAVATIKFAFADAYPTGGGNGIAWFVELDDCSRTLASGVIERGGRPTGNMTLPDVEVSVGQRLNFVVDSNDDHACDWTRFDGVITAAKR